MHSYCITFTYIHIHIYSYTPAETREHRPRPARVRQTDRLRPGQAGQDRQDLDALWDAGLYVRELHVYGVYIHCYYGV